MIDKICF